MFLSASCHCDAGGINRSGGKRLGSAILFRPRLEALGLRECLEAGPSRSQACGRLETQLNQKAPPGAFRAPSKTLAVTGS
jgi:hypothetical protein